jgi:DNA (cytosine-5)-methyltransferase 1
MKSVELFAGAGGLALGGSLAGVTPIAAVEWNRLACETLRLNGEVGSLVLEEDARAVDYSSLSGPVDLVTGGPPCQPFSMGGKHKGSADSRDMFPEAVRAVRELEPLAFIFENVKGLLRPSFGAYLRYTVRQLERPDVERIPGESWESHLSRLESSGRARYSVTVNLVNAADYGVPQKRERVFFIGFRGERPDGWSFPAPTHSRYSLERDQLETGEYWARHGLQGPATRIAVRKASSELLAWRTVRDAIGDLPAPGESLAISGHQIQPGARQYPGHTGSLLDRPAKAIKAGAHGVPGGENMIAYADGSVRYFTARETARLQTFPDSYRFAGAWSEVMRQLGNAVPVELARIVVESVASRVSR